MRLIYPQIWSQPNRNADREQAVSTAAALARRGLEVTLLLPRGPGDPSLGADDLRAYFEVEGDFRVVQRSSPWAGPALARTIMWLRQVARDPELRGADILYSRIPAMLAIGPLSPLPFATEHYRLWPDEMPFIRPLVRRSARSPRCLGLVLHSDYAAGAYRRAGVADSKILVAHNGAEPLGPDRLVDKPTARKRVGLPTDRFIVAYAGRVNQEKGLDEVLALADLRPDILFLLVGSEKPGAVEAEAARRDNVRIEPWQSRSTLWCWLRAADALLVPPSRAPLHRYRNCVLPMKIFAYFAAGRPIVAPQAPDTAELLVANETALLVPPGNPRAAAAALDRLRDPALANALAAKGLICAAEFTWDRRAEKIAAFLDAGLRRGSAARRGGDWRGYGSGPRSPAAG